VSGQLMAAAAPSAAQVHGSEAQTLEQVISGTTISIEYACPSVRGREPFFGGLVPWTAVWTPGANAATQLEVSADFKLGEAEIPAGAYSLWLQPHGNDSWPLMLHADTSLFHVPHRTMDQAFMAADPDMTPEERSSMNAYWTAQRTPRPVEIMDNNETGQLTVSDPLLDNVLGDEEWRRILPPRLRASLPTAPRGTEKSCSRVALSGKASRMRPVRLFYSTFATTKQTT